jgi:hypothetical protein
VAQKTVRADVSGYWCEGYVKADVPPSEILKVEHWSPKEP